MILKFMGIALLFSLVVLGVGWGRVLLPQLVARTVLVFLGTVVCLVAARKSVDVFVSTPPTASAVDADVDLGDPESGEQGVESTPASSQEDSGDGGEPPTEEPAGEQTADSREESTPEDLGDDAEVEELAEMVSQTMAEDEGSG